MAKGTSEEAKVKKTEHLDELLNQAKKGVDLEEKIKIATSYTGDKRNNSINELRETAYKAGEKYGEYPRNNIKSPDGLKDKPDEILRGASLALLDANKESVDYINSNLESVIDEIDDEHITKEEIIRNNLVASEAEKDYQEVAGKYLENVARLKQAKEIKESDFDKLSPQERLRIYRAIAPLVEREKAKELYAKGLNEEYISAITALARAAAEEGDIPERLVSKAKEEYVKELEKEAEGYRKSTEGKKGIVEYVKDSLKKLVREGEAERDRAVIRLLHEAYKK